MPYFHVYGKTDSGRKVTAKVQADSQKHAMREVNFSAMGASAITRRQYEAHQKTRPSTSGGGKRRKKKRGQSNVMAWMKFGGFFMSVGGAIAAGGAWMLITQSESNLKPVPVELRVMLGGGIALAILGFFIFAAYRLFQDN